LLLDLWESVVGDQGRTLETGKQRRVGLENQKEEK